MSVCTVCPNNCKVDRDAKAGGCGVTNQIKLAKYALHFYEEPVISGENGSGAVFFSGCSLNCAFCQNYELSHKARGKEFSIDGLATIFKELEEMGANNINLVNPTHYSLQIVKALDKYRPNIPIVWNTHGYETLQNLSIIDPYVDIYLPDLKYYTPSRARRYTKKENYFERAKDAISFMLNAKKPVMENGLLKRGVIVRHLVLPENTDDSIKILEFLRPIIGDNYLSIMSQYTPFGSIENLKELNRKITRREYQKVVDKALSLGFENLFLQDFTSSGEEFIPDWDY